LTTFNRGLIEFDPLTVDLDLLRHLLIFRRSLLRRDLCATELVTTLAAPDGRIKELSCRQQRVRSKLLAMNPQEIQISPSLQSLCEPFQIGFLFQVGRLRRHVNGATGANESIPSRRHRAKAALK
jgi:hypothetical protein